MLRMQLPVLLSFAWMRCFIGQAAGFGARRVLPHRVGSFCRHAGRAARSGLLAANLSMLISSLATSTTFFEQWKKAALLEHPVPNHMACSEFACTRVQGLACGIGLFTLLGTSDPFVLSLALSTLKGVADGSVCVLLTSSFVVAACAGLHHSRPRWFFAILYLSCSVHTSQCYYNDDVEMRGRIGCSVLSLCFATLFLFCATLRRVLAWATRPVVRLRAVVGGALSRRRNKEE